MLLSSCLIQYIIPSTIKYLKRRENVIYSRLTLTLREGVGCRCDRERKEAPMERERAECGYTVHEVPSRILRTFPTAS